MNGNTTGFEDDDLRDPALRRALDHAPDRDAMPDARTRDAILKMAHNLAAAPGQAAGTAANSASVLPWWRRLLGGGEPRSRMPWNAAFATVLVAAFVTVLWRSEPVPDARLDGEARVGGAAAPAPAAEVPATPPASSAPAGPVAPAAPAAPAPAAAAEPAPPPPIVAKPAPPAPAAEQRAKAAPRDASSAKEAARAPAPSRAATPAPVAPAAPAVMAEQAAPPQASAPAPAQDERRERFEARAEGERQRALSAAPAPAAAAPAPGAATLSRRSQDASAPASQADASAQASGALQDAAPRAAKAARLQAAPPAFSALERWTSFSAGAGARRARGDVEGLPALVGTVARSATSPDASLDAPVEARLSLYRGDTLVAVLEIAGEQVRWTPQPGGTALVGTPPAQALDALRSLLAR